MKASRVTSRFGNLQSGVKPIGICHPTTARYRLPVRRQRQQPASKRALIALSVGSTLMALLLCEVIVRFAGLVPNVHAIWRDDPNSIYQRSANPMLGHELKPDYRREFPRGLATANSHGFRDRERTRAKPAGTRRLIMLGDSVVEGVNYVADPDTPSRKLENVLTDAEVLNFGISGYCTLAEVELLETRGLAFKPDDVIIMFTGNDFDNVVPEHTMAGGVAERPTWAKVLFVRSALYRLLCLKFDWFSFAEEQDPIARNREAIGANNVVTAFERLHELANQHGFRVLIAIWPDFRREGIADFENESGPRLLVERLAATHGLPTIRLAPAFRGHFAEVNAAPDPRTFYTVDADGMHPNRTGAEVAAGILKEYLIDSTPPGPPYQPGAPDPEAVAEAARRGGNDEVPEDMDFEQRTFLSMRYQGRVKESEDYLREVIKGDPDHLFANAYLGKFQVERGEYEAALPHLTTALRLSPDVFDIRVMLADAIFHQQGKQAALECLAEGLQRTPGNPHFHLAAGRVFLRSGETNAARLELQRVISIAPEFPGVTDLSQKIEATAGSAIQK